MLPSAEELRNGRGQLVCRNDRERSVANRAVGNQRAAVRSPNDRQRRERGMGAALGAAGNMDHGRLSKMRRDGSGNTRRQGARGNMGGGADRRAGAGDDMPARVAGTRDEAEAFRGSGKGRRG